MTDLHCSVMGCSNNKDDFCCRPDIMVGGPNSRDAKQTYCANFLDASDAPSNSVDQASPNATLDIHCEVMNCAYNRNRACDAGHVDIHTTQVNGGQIKTECATFKTET